MLLSTLLVGTIFTGCSQKITHVDATSKTLSLDFTKYQKNKFLITPGEYGGDYTAVGMFTFIKYPESDFVENKKHYEKSYWSQKTVKEQEVLDLAYESAKSRGADAITHFKISPIIKNMNDGLKDFTITGIKITGLLIKRNI